SEWSLRWYSYALSQSLFVTSAWNSFWLALVATALATPAAIAAALAIARYRFPGRDMIQTVLMAPLFVPSIIISLSILVTLAGAGMRNVTMRLVIAHVLIVFPYIVRTVIASLAQLNPQIEEAARTLGA